MQDGRLSIPMTQVAHIEVHSGLVRETVPPRKRHALRQSVGRSSVSSSRIVKISLSRTDMRWNFVDPVPHSWAKQVQESVLDHYRICDRS